MDGCSTAKIKEMNYERGWAKGGGESQERVINLGERENLWGTFVSAEYARGVNSQEAISFLLDGTP